MAHDVFISYSSKDKPIADAVCAGLEGRGIRCWMAPRDILPGDAWPAAIIAAIGNCHLFVLVASHESYQSTDVLREVQYAANLVPIIPFRIEAADLPPAMRFYLGVPHWLDALTPPLEGHIQRLAETVGLLLQRADASIAVAPGPAPTPVAADERAAEGPAGQPGEEATGPDGGVMVWVPPGEFMMGSNDGGDDERPVHKVRITQGFWLGKHTVTNGQYQAFCKATGRPFPTDSDQGDDHPVVYVSWEEAVAYCAHYGLRLPTEAEWEYAARGPEGRMYPWGDERGAKRCCNYENTGPNGQTHPVGRFPSGASWCGALDLAGSVWEWCADVYAEDYYRQSPEADPRGPAEGTERALRGGSWGDYPGYCRSANRDYGDPTSGNNAVGFRVAGSP